MLQQLAHEQSTAARPFGDVGLQAIGDRVTARRIAEPTVRIAAITGLVKDLPLEAEKTLQKTCIF